MPIFAAVARWILNHRPFTILILLAMLSAALVGGLRVSADFSVEAFFGSDDHEVTELAEYKRLWGDDDSIMVVVVEASEGSMLDPARLAVLEDLVATLDAAPEVEGTISITNAPLLLGEAPGMLELRSITETQPDDPETEQSWRARILSNTALVPFLLSEDTLTASIIVDLDANADDVKVLAPIVDRVRDLALAFSGEAGVWIGTAGIPAVRSDFFKLIFEDQVVVMPAVMLLIGLLLFLLFRRVHGVLVPGLAALLPTGLVFGVMGFKGEPVGILNQNYFTLLPEIVVADAIHLVSRFHE